MVRVACSGTLQPLISSDIVGVVSKTKLMQASNTTYCDLAADWMNNTGGGYCGGTLNGIINHLDYIEVRNMPGCMLPLNLLPSLMRESSVLVLLPQSESDDKLL